MSLTMRMPQQTPMMIDAGRRAVRIGRVDRADAEQPFDAADNAANRAADDASDRPRSVVADIGAMSNAVRDALSLRRERHSQCCEEGGSKQTAILHAITFLF